jgi:hypothetical protein
MAASALAAVSGAIFVPVLVRTSSSSASAGRHWPCALFLRASVSVVAGTLGDESITHAAQHSKAHSHMFVGRINIGMLVLT